MIELWSAVKSRPSTICCVTAAVGGHRGAGVAGVGVVAPCPA